MFWLGALSGFMVGALTMGIVAIILSVVLWGPPEHYFSASEHVPTDYPPSKPR